MALGDGADWLRRLYRTWFPNAVRIVDFFHAAEYLWAAARGRHGDDAKAAKRWAEKLCRLLEAGRMDDVLGAAPPRRGSRGTRQGGPLPVRAARQVAFWQCACPEEVEKATSARRHVGNRRFLATEIADAAEP